MAKLLSEDLELEFLFCGCYDYHPIQIEFKITLKWKGIPILNERAMKRGTDYWNKGAVGGIIAEEIDNFTLIRDLEEAFNNKTTKIWESWPDPDMCISIYPERYFPYLNDKDDEYNTIIISPDTYQFKDCDAYNGYEGISFIMTPTNDELQKFINDLKVELDQIKNNIQR
jgi:hypothetical protein